MIAGSLCEEGRPAPGGPHTLTLDHRIKHCKKQALTLAFDAGRF